VDARCRSRSIVRLAERHACTFLVDDGYASVASVEFTVL
jgi:hypothetical protein